jgi:hypothetical protein
MNYDTSELHRTIKDLRASTKGLVKTNRYREGVWKDRLEAAEAKLREVGELPCPHGCDDGSIAIGSNADGWEQQQCQWCYELQAIINRGDL